MRLALMTLITLLVAAASGFGATWLALAERPLTGAIALGPWRAWPGSGAQTPDPYMRAVIARTAALPLGAGEGIELIAETDSDGERLSGACVYEISGRTPEARTFTLAVTRLSTSGRSRRITQSDPLAQPMALTSEGLLRDAAGGVRITAAASPQPGDWLATPAGSPFRLTLRLYDSPKGFASRPGASSRLMPEIRRKHCS